MPLYAFEVVDPAGNVVAHFDVACAIENRDAMTLRRRVIPDTLNISGVAQNPEANQVLRRYHAEECKLGSEFSKRSGFTAETVKSAWGN